MRDSAKAAYVERFDLNGKIKYQALTDDGYALSDLESDSKVALKALHDYDPETPVIYVEKEVLRYFKERIKGRY